MTLTNGPLEPVDPPIVVKFVGRSPRNILVIKLGALGDIVQVTGLLRDIHDHHHGAKVTILTEGRFRALMERCPWVDDVIIDPRAPRVRIDQLWALRKDLLRRQFDFVYDLQNNARTAHYHRWMNTPWSGRATGFDHLEYIRGGKSALESLAAQLANAGVVLRHALAPDVSWMADDVSELLRHAGVRPGFILLIPGSSARHSGKRWPHYAKLARRLIAEGHQVVTAPGPDELELCCGIPGYMLLDSGRPLSTFQLVGLGREAGFVIGNDTGPSHLVAHSGAKGLVLFGSHAAAASTHIDRRFAILEVRCLDQLTVEEVHAAYGNLSKK